ncbi:unnamed protein product [Enterobius vermicularis]|uniref:Transposase n=1 Tax=Enterobius vermicularis TaxID=51028 RepID=A0A0N4VPY5_ENTVE|nr:unnamed protein product [Enterobius vermicularis]
MNSDLLSLAQGRKQELLSADKRKDEYIRFGKRKDDSVDYVLFSVLDNENKFKVICLQ